MIKAIETEYKGYKFRSRLEARWAVFFDALGIEWKYEPQGFDLDNGEGYLPDFFLPCVKHIEFPFPYGSEDGGKPPLCKDDTTGLFVEVKGEMSEEDAKKIYDFSLEAPIIVVGEVPQNVTDAYSMYLKQKYNHAGFEFGDFDGALITKNIDGFKSNEMLFTNHCGEFFCCGMHSDWWGGEEDMNKALLKARQARFEHGETPS